MKQAVGSKRPLTQTARDLGRNKNTLHGCDAQCHGKLQPGGAYTSAACLSGRSPDFPRLRFTGTRIVARTDSFYIQSTPTLLLETQDQLRDHASPRFAHDVAGALVLAQGNAVAGLEAPFLDGKS